MFMHTCNFVLMILTPWPQLEGRLVKSRPGGPCASWGWLAPCPLPGWSLTQAPPAAGWAEAGRFGGGERGRRPGGKGLSFGVHIWEPLAHSCRLSACLRMDLDRTGREGLGGWFAPADGNPDGSRRQPGPAGGKEAREALPGAVRAPFPCAGPQGRLSHRLSLFYLIKAGGKAGEGQSDTPILDLAVQPM